MNLLNRLNLWNRLGAVFVATVAVRRACRGAANDGADDETVCAVGSDRTD